DEPLHKRREPMGKTTLEWSQEMERRLEHLVALRRDFHRHPELSFQEHRTAQIIAERLHTAGLEVRTNIAGTTAVMGILHGDKRGRTIAWRADIDALPLTELLDVPFASGTPGIMHACGHDGHTAIAITLAEILAARRADVPGTAEVSVRAAWRVVCRDQDTVQARGVGKPDTGE